LTLNAKALRNTPGEINLKVIFWFQLAYSTMDQILCVHYMAYVKQLHNAKSLFSLFTQRQFQKMLRVLLTFRNGQLHSKFAINTHNERSVKAGRFLDVDIAGE